MPVIEADHIRALICALANVDKKRLMTWQTISVAAWAIGTGGAAPRR
ncbi:hypothetical protein [Paenibacillus alvei]|nr:hypothetical protein [Paenibacillus alvei]MCY7486273.1 hypothetical protein [Paenibacillus alvei]